MDAVVKQLKRLDHIIIYLRKSRQDDPRETVEEVLSKHETLLQEFVAREFGGFVPEDNIYREIVSGESIAAREKVQEVLSRIEDPAVSAVVVVEPSRLSRGDLADCSKIITAFRFSRTLVSTPMMTYDLERKMERKFFQDELLRGNDYLEYVKDILSRGRVAAVKRGCHISRPPYGYNSIRIGKDWTLEPNENADIVRLIFKMYTEEGKTRRQIADYLNSLGIKSPRGLLWYRDAIRQILHNVHYIGKVAYNQTKTETVLEAGEVKKAKVKAPEEEVIIAEGRHEAIIDLETWEKARSMDGPPRLKSDRALKNPLARILYCKKCGKALHRKTFEQRGGGRDRYVCRSSPSCYRSVACEDLLDSLIYALENSELPALEMKLKNGDGNSRKIQERIVKKLEKKMEELKAQEARQYEFLEKGRYTEEVFDERNGILRAEMEEVRVGLYKAKASLPESVNFEERIATLQTAIDLLKDPEATADEKNKILRVIVSRVEYSALPNTGSNKKDQSHAGPMPFTLDIQLRL